MKKLKEAFLKYDVRLESHKGNIDYFISDYSVVCPTYNNGDIVFIKKDDITKNDNHLFVIIDDCHFIGKLLTTCRCGEKIIKDNNNHLMVDSYLTDELYQLEPNKILFKIGTIDNYESVKNFV